MGITDAFAKYGAKRKNITWSVSAENDSGELVVSLWQQYFRAGVEGQVKYVDHLSRWSGHGNVEFRERISRAYREKQTVRAVIARTSDPLAVDRGEDASKLNNTFSVKKNWIGKVTRWDGDNFEIEFSIS